MAQQGPVITKELAITRSDGPNPINNNHEHAFLKPSKMHHGPSDLALCVSSHGHEQSGISTTDHWKEKVEIILRLN